METKTLISNIPEWSGINNDISEIFENIAVSGPATLEILELDLYQITMNIQGFAIVVTTAIEMPKSGNLVCCIEADCRYRTTESFQICNVLGEVVSSCVCDDSGIHLLMESGLSLRCRRDHDFENYSLHYPYPERAGNIVFL